MATSREVKQGQQGQGQSESIVYDVTTTPWGSSPTNVEVKVYDITNGTYSEVTSTVMPTGSPAVNGDVITLPALTGLTYLHYYQIEIKFTTGSNTFECYARIFCDG